MAALAGMLGKSIAKTAARKIRSEAENTVRDLKKDAVSMAQDFRNQAQTRATNYLDAQKHRIYETSRGAVYSNTSGGNRNYRPTPSYMNVPGSNVIRPINNRPQMFR